MHIVALAGGVGGARLHPGPPPPPRHHTRTRRSRPSRSSPTPVTTSPSSACASVPTSTRCSTRWAAGYTRDRAGDALTRATASKVSSRHTVLCRSGSHSATSTSRRTSCVHSGSARVLSLSDVTARLGRSMGVAGQANRLVPMTDVPVETHVVVDDESGGERAIHFQEWWVRHQAAIPAHRFVVAGLDRADRGSRGARRDPAGRRRAAATEQPGGVDRHHPRRAGCARCVARHRCSRRRRLAADLGPTGARTRRRVPRGHRGRDHGAGGRRPLRGLPRRLARRPRGRRHHAAPGPGRGRSTGPLADDGRRGDRAASPSTRCGSPPRCPA